MPVYYSVLNVKALLGASNQEKLRDCTTSPIYRLQPASPATTRSRAQLWSPPLPPTLRSPDIPRGVDNIEYLETIQNSLENVKFIQILIIPLFFS